MPFGQYQVNDKVYNKLNFNIHNYFFAKALDQVRPGGVAKDGKTPKDTRTGCQKKALEKYVKDFHRRFPDVRIVGHNELAAKACPSFDVQKWLKEIGINQ